MADELRGEAIRRALDLAIGALIVMSYNTTKPDLLDDIRAVADLLRAHGGDLAKAFDHRVAPPTGEEPPLPEVEEGAYLRARGILPPNPGDPRPEEAIRRIRERIGTLAAASALAERVRALEAALRTIATFGQVCSEYDTCTHRACAASYSAWATATEALGKEGKGDD